MGSSHAQRRLGLSLELSPPGRGQGQACTLASQVVHAGNPSLTKSPRKQLHRTALPPGRPRRPGLVARRPGRCDHLVPAPRGRGVRGGRPRLRVRAHQRDGLHQVRGRRLLPEHPGQVQPVQGAATRTGGDGPAAQPPGQWRPDQLAVRLLRARPGQDRRIGVRHARRVPGDRVLAVWRFGRVHRRDEIGGRVWGQQDCGRVPAEGRDEGRGGQGVLHVRGTDPVSTVH